MQMNTVDFFKNYYFFCKWNIVIYSSILIFPNKQPKNHINYHCMVLIHLEHNN